MVEQTGATELVVAIVQPAAGVDLRVEQGKRRVHLLDSRIEVLLPVAIVLEQAAN